MPRFILPLAGFLIVATPAVTAERGVDLVNRASKPLEAVAIRAGDAAWSANLLQGQLAPGRTVTLRLSSDQGTCAFEVRATLPGGAQVTQAGMDLCKATQIEFYEDGADVAKLRVP